MLASLLPGLRDLRVPLAVGYLWITVAWLQWGSSTILQRPEEAGPHQRAFDAATSLGPTTMLAATSFVAYVVGAVLVIPESLILKAAEKLLRAGSTEADYAHLIESAELNIDMSMMAPGNADLPTRLLVANSELFGQYDRYAAEASFRVNVVPPLTAAVTLAAFSYANAWIFLGYLPLIGLLVSGLLRAQSATRVVMRAVLENIISHPYVEELKALEAGAREMGQVYASPSIENLTVQNGGSFAGSFHIRVNNKGVAPVVLGAYVVHLDAKVPTSSGELKKVRLKNTILSALGQSITITGNDVHVIARDAAGKFDDAHLSAGAQDFELVTELLVTDAKGRHWRRNSYGAWEPAR